MNTLICSMHPVPNTFLFSSNTYMYLDILVSTFSFCIYFYPSPGNKTWSRRPRNNFRPLLWIIRRPLCWNSPRLEGEPKLGSPPKRTGTKNVVFIFFKTDSTNRLTWKPLWSSICLHWYIFPSICLYLPNHLSVSSYPLSLSPRHCELPEVASHTFAP